MESIGFRQQTYLSGRTDRVQQLAHVSLADGASNTMLGLNAGAKSTGYRNTYVGANVASSSKTSSNNVVVGANAGEFMRNSNDNVALGRRAAQFMNIGTYNVVVGTQAGEHMKRSSYNTVVGYRSGGQMISGARNTFVGSLSGYYTFNASDNVFVGESAGMQNRYGHRNTFLGTGAGKSSSRGNNSVLIGYYAAANGESIDGSVVIGSNVAPGANVVGNSVVLGSGAAAGAANVTESVIVGRGAGAGLVNVDSSVMLGTSSGAGSTGAFNTYVGRESGAGASGNLNAAVGYLAASPSMAGDRNAVLGFGAASSLRGNLNVVLGANAASTANCDQSTIVGAFAGANVRGNTNSVVGYGAASSLRGNLNVVFGANAAALSNSSSSTLVGAGAGRLLQGDFNTAVGALTSANVVGAYNTATGYGAATDCVGNALTAVGAFSAQQVRGNALTAVGYLAGGNVVGDRNTFVGFGAGSRTSGNALTAIGDGAAGNVIGERMTFIGSRTAGLVRGSDSFVAGQDHFSASADSAVPVTLSNVVLIGANVQRNDPGGTGSPLQLSNAVVLGAGLGLSNDDSESFVVGLNSVLKDQRAMQFRNAGTYPNYGSSILLWNNGGNPTPPGYGIGATPRYTTSPYGSTPISGIPAGRYKVSFSALVHGYPAVVYPDPVPSTLRIQGSRVEGVIAPQPTYLFNIYVPLTQLLQGGGNGFISGLSVETFVETTGAGSIGSLTFNGVAGYDAALVMGTTSYYWSDMKLELVSMSAGRDASFGATVDPNSLEVRSAMASFYENSGEYGSGVGLATKGPLFLRSGFYGSNLPATAATANTDIVLCCGQSTAPRVQISNTLTTIDGNNALKISSLAGVSGRLVKLNSDGSLSASSMNSERNTFSDPAANDGPSHRAYVGEYGAGLLRVAIKYMSGTAHACLLISYVTTPSSVEATVLSSHNPNNIVINDVTTSGSPNFYIEIVTPSQATSVSFLFL
jgi:hypothetical protein